MQFTNKQITQLNCGWFFFLQLVFYSRIIQSVTPKEAKREVRAATLNFESKMASKVKDYKKTFFSYVRSK